MHARTLSIAVSVTITATLAALVNPHTAEAARPPFQLPVPCGQTWDASTYDGHWPDQDSLDLGQRDANNANVSEGEPVLASAAGEVTDVFTAPSGSRRVYIDHGDGWVSHYIHNEGLPPIEGQKVAQGEQIGRTSNSGTEAMHIHYTQLEDGDAVRSVFNGTAVATHAGDPSSWDTWGSTNAEEITSVNCAGNAFLSWTDDGDRYQLIYKPSNGEVKIVRLDDDGTGVTTTWTGQWTLGWTHLVSFTASLTGQPHALLYKSSTGQASFAQLLPGGAGVVVLKTNTWNGGWTSFVPFTRGNNRYLIAYNSLDGAAKILRVKVTGDGITVLSSNSWIRGRTSLIPYTLGSKQYLLLYRGGSGAVEVNEITGSGNSIGIQEVWSGTWTGGWTDLVPVTHDGSRYLVGYKAATGQVGVFKLRAAGQGISTVASASWTRGWTAFSPLSIDGKGNLLIYKLATGEVKVVRLKSGGVGFDTIWQGSWTLGWT